MGPCGGRGARGPRGGREPTTRGTRGWREETARRPQARAPARLPLNALAATGALASQRPRGQQAE
jgi:hypothetical protein